MIPKIIHYCWFGRKQLPNAAIKCINSWRRYLPEYTIKEWNESNFDLRVCDYVEEAYQEKRWAFVSDYARFKILYEEGGLYFDTDVEVIKDLDNIIRNGPFMACEPSNCIYRYDEDGKLIFDVYNPSQKDRVIRYAKQAIAPGLGLAAEPGMKLYKEILDYYDNQHFRLSDGKINDITVVKHVTNLMLKYGFKDTGDIECIAGVSVYPNDYFCPKNYSTGVITFTENTRAIHHYSSSWLTPCGKAVASIQSYFNRFGGKGRKVGRILSFPFRIIRKIETRGVKGTIDFIIKKDT